MAGGRFELAMEPMAIGLVHAILIHLWEGVDFMGIYMLCNFKNCRRFMFIDTSKGNYSDQENGHPFIF